MTHRRAERLSGVIAHLRRDHADVELREQDVSRDPLEEFGKWLDAALAAELVLPNAMTLATATSDGRPSARMILLKGFDERGFVFYTNYDSRKAAELAANPRAALVFHWPQLERQVRAGGWVRRVERSESQSYWRTRPLGTRLGAWASPQSAVIPGRATLDHAFAAVTARFEGRDVPLPPNWGGYVLVPEEIEFWQGRRDRLHDRLRYRRAEGGWLMERLAP